MCENGPDLRTEDHPRRNGWPARFVRRRSVCADNSLSSNVVEEAACRDVWTKCQTMPRMSRGHPGKLFSPVGFVVTNLQMEPAWIIRFYNPRGTAGQHIKEGQQAINWTRLFCKGMAKNKVRLQRDALAYTLGVFLQGKDLSKEMADWSLTSLQIWLIKIGARVVRYARAMTFQLAETAIRGDTFNRIFAEIQRLCAPPLPA